MNICCCASVSLLYMTLCMLCVCVCVCACVFMHACMSVHVCVSNIILHRFCPRMNQVCREGSMGCLYMYVCVSVPGVRGSGWMYMCVCMWCVSMCEHYCVCVCVCVCLG